MDLDDPGSIIWILQLAGFLLLFPFSVLFSAYETAFVSIGDNESDSLNESEKNHDKKVAKLITQNPNYLLISLLIGNTLVNVSISTLAVLLTQKLCNLFVIPHAIGLIIEVALVGTLILIIGEILPKTFAIRNRVKFLVNFVNPIMFFYGMFYPLTFIIDLILNIFTKRIKNFKGLAKLTRSDIGNLMEVGGEDGVLEEDEKNMITSIFEFGSKTAKEIMVPRVDIKAIEDTISKEELLSFIRESGFSRIPVYNENIDNIVGILYIKDLLSYLDDSKEKEEILITKILREGTFIPESKDLGDLLKMFQKEKIHIAIVVDEYGGTSGMITLEDIIEEIVGEIQDEFDREENLYRKVSDFCYEFDAKVPIDEVNEILNIELPEEEDYESLGGFIYFLFEEIPEIGDKKRWEDLTFTVLSVDKQRLLWVKIDIDKPL